MSPLRTRIRLRYAKLGKIRFTSHRDTARIWERALRRAELPVAYSEGFSPRPRVSFGLALATGHESLGEYLDVDLDAASAEAMAIDVDGLPARLDAGLPVGFTVQAAAVVEPGTPSLQEAVVSCTWRLEVSGDPGEVAAAAESILGADQLVVTRQRKGREVTDDLRPALQSLALVGPTPSGIELETELATQPRAMRPDELLRALVGDPLRGRVCRTHQWIIVDGDRREPLLAPLSTLPTTHHSMLVGAS